MTVCVAALCDINTIVGASDRMITSGDTLFEPEQAKLWYLTASIVVMISGDVSLQTEIMAEVQSVVTEAVSANPNNWWRVKDVVDLYVHFYNQARWKRAEDSILAPLGLTSDTLIRRQKEMNVGIVEQLTAELRTFQFKVGSVILAGVDNSGAQLWAVTDGDPRYRNTLGYAAIGYGRSHASSMFMARKHTRYRQFPETLFLAYSAKKRAEIAPGVGTATDMFTIGPGLGTFSSLEAKHLDKLERWHQETVEKENRARQRAEENTRKYVAKENASSERQKQKVASPGFEDGVGDNFGGDRETPRT